MKNQRTNPVQIICRPQLEGHMLKFMTGRLEKSRTSMNGGGRVFTSKINMAPRLRLQSQISVNHLPYGTTPFEVLRPKFTHHAQRHAL